MALTYPISKLRSWFVDYGAELSREHVQAVTVNKNIFLFYSNPFIIINNSLTREQCSPTSIETFIFNTDDLSWSRVSKLKEPSGGYNVPTALEYILAIAVNHEVWIFGHPYPSHSADEELCPRRVLRFNTKNFHWDTIRTSGEIPRTYPFSDPICELEDKIYVFHNIGDEHSERSIYSLDLGSRMWRRVLSNAWDEGWMASNAVPLGKKIYVLLKNREQELNGGDCFLSRLSVYDVESGTWQLIELSCQGPRNYYCLHTFVYTGNIYAVENGCKPKQRRCVCKFDMPPKVMKYSPRENEWTAATIEGVYLHSSDTFSVVDDRVFFFDVDNSVCVLDFLPTLCKLSIAAVRKYNLDVKGLPSVLIDELKEYDNYLLILKELQKN